MAISHLSRRILNASSSTTKLLPALNLPKTSTHVPNPNPLFLLHPHPHPHRHFSTPPPKPPTTSSSHSLESMRHQEIEGPTVERDTSQLADETRRELDALRGSVRRLSAALALLGGAHLAAGAWIASGAVPAGVPTAAALQGVSAFVFPFTAALVLRRSIKHIAFFQKMEANGRLQVLTLCLQVVKNVSLMLLRTRVVAISCALGVSVGSVAAILIR